jgi:hypothetical protein
MCKQNDESPIRDRYHELLKELKSINHRLEVLEGAANNGVTPQAYATKLTMEWLKQEGVI